MFIAIALGGYAILALVVLLDKILVSQKGERIDPGKLTVVSTAPLALLFLCIPFGVVWPSSVDQAIIIGVSGASFTIALYAMYRGFLGSEVSHSGPLVGAFTTVGAVIFATALGVEHLSPKIVWAIIILVAGSLVISYEQSREHHGWHRAMLLATLAGALFALSNVTAKIAYEALGFYSGFIFTRLAAGICGLCAIVLVDWKKQKTKKNARKNSWFIFSLDKILGAVGVVVVQYAVGLGSVSIVTALSGAEYAILILVVALLSWLAPRFFKEVYAPRELVRELFGVALITLGILLSI